MALVGVFLVCMAAILDVRSLFRLPSGAKAVAACVHDAAFPVSDRAPSEDELRSMAGNFLVTIQAAASIEAGRLRKSCRPRASTCAWFFPDETFPSPVTYRKGKDARMAELLASEIACPQIFQSASGYRYEGDILILLGNALAV